MSTGKIGVDYAAHSAATQTMGDALDGTRQTVSNLQASVDAVMAGWKGDASAAAVAAHARLHEAAVKLNTQIDQCHSALDQGRNTMSSTDSDSTHGFTSLSI